MPSCPVCLQMASPMAAPRQAMPPPWRVALPEGILPPAEPPRQLVVALPIARELQLRLSEKESDALRIVVAGSGHAYYYRALEHAVRLFGARISLAWTYFDNVPTSVCGAAHAVSPPTYLSSNSTDHSPPHGIAFWPYRCTVVKQHVERRSYPLIPMGI